MLLWVKYLLAYASVLQFNWAGKSNSSYGVVLSWWFFIWARLGAGFPSSRWVWSIWAMQSQLAISVMLGNIVGIENVLLIVFTILSLLHTNGCMESLLAQGLLCWVVSNFGEIHGSPGKTRVNQTV